MECNGHSNAAVHTAACIDLNDLQHSAEPLKAGLPQKPSTSSLFVAAATANNALPQVPPPVLSVPLCQCEDHLHDAAMRRVASEHLLTHRKRNPICRERLVANVNMPLHSYYVVKQKVGQGTWGSVHVAVDRQSGLERAVKKIPKQRFASELFRFRQEISLLKSVDHPNIIRLYETFEDYANIYMVMEHCTGGELFDRLASIKYFDEAKAASLVRQILSATCHCHSRGIAHRDLKPENFLFLSEEANSPMKLIDFGLAKRLTSKRKLRTKVGTLYYISPEVLKGVYDEKCDIWSCGIIMYLLLCGAPPFNGLTDAAILHQVINGVLKYDSNAWKHISPEAKNLTRQLLSRDPKLRPSAEEALQHPWFKKFTPSFMCTFSMPRPLSVPLLENLCGASGDPVWSLQDGTPVPRYNAADKQALAFGNLAAKLVPKWRRFAQHNQLKRAALAVIAHHMNDAQDMPSVREIFCALDAAGDGVLTEQELVDGLRSIHAYRRLATLAGDDTNTIQMRMKAAATITGLCVKCKGYLKHRTTNENGLIDIPRHEVPMHKARDGTEVSLQRHISSSSTRDSSHASLQKQQWGPNDTPSGENTFCLSVHDMQRLSHGSISSLESPDNTDGAIQDDEMYDECDEAVIRNLAEEMCLYGTANIKYSEFLAACLDRTHYTQQPFCKAAFRVFDRDGDGKISKAELRAALGWDLLSLDCDSAEGTESQLNEIMELADADKDGAIGFEDFMSVMQFDALSSRYFHEEEEVHTEDKCMHAEDMHTEDMHTEDKHTEDMRTEDKHTEDRHAEDKCMHTADRHTEDMRTADMRTADKCMHAVEEPVSSNKRKDSERANGSTSGYGPIKIPLAPPKLFDYGQDTIDFFGM